MKAKKTLEFSDFFYKMKKTERIAVLYHRDADGFCSALVVAKAIERLRGKKPDFFSSHGYEIIDAKAPFFSALKKKKVSKTIIVDLSVDQNPGIIKELETFSDVLLIDHHKLYNDLSGKKTVFIKAQFLSNIDPSRYPASKLCFDLFNEIVDLRDLAWIACIGILGDFGYHNWADFFDKTMEKNKTSLPELKKLKELVEAVSVVSLEKTGLLFEDFLAARNPQDLLANKHWKAIEELNAEVDCWFDSIKERAEFFPELELVWLEIKSKRSIKSSLINRLSSELFPNQTVIVVEDRAKPLLFFSARRQDFKVKMNDLLETAVNGINGASAGGHIPAAAGKVPRASLKKFKQNILNLLKAKK